MPQKTFQITVKLSMLTYASLAYRYSDESIAEALADEAEAWARNHAREIRQDEPEAVGALYGEKLAEAWTVTP